MNQVQIKYHVTVAKRNETEIIITQVKPIGPFAIHRRLEGDGWNLTHVQTGMTVVQRALNTTLLKLLAMELLDEFPQPEFWDINNNVDTMQIKYVPVQRFMRDWVQTHIGRN